MPVITGNKNDAQIVLLAALLEEINGSNLGSIAKLYLNTWLMDNIRSLQDGNLEETKKEGVKNVK